MTTVIDLSSDDETPLAVQQTKSDEVTTTTKEPFSKENEQHCQPSLPASTNKTKTCDIQDNLLLDDNEFIAHVVMIWLGRVRNGYKNVQMPDSILMSKAKEAAGILDSVDTFCPQRWIRTFRNRVARTIDKGGPIDFETSNTFRIEEIIKEERKKLFKKTIENPVGPLRQITVKYVEAKQSQLLKEIEESHQKELDKILQAQKKHLEKVKETQKREMKRLLEIQKQVDSKDSITIKNRLVTIAPASRTKICSSTPAIPSPVPQQQICSLRPAFPSPAPVPPPALIETPAPAKAYEETIVLDDVLDDPIQSYDEVFDCLQLVENYLMCVRNTKAVLFVARIEEFLKQQLDSKPN